MVIALVQNSFVAVQFCNSNPKRVGPSISCIAIVFIVKLIYFVPIVYAYWISHYLILYKYK